jgi:hypothetical protein
MTKTTENKLKKFGLPAGYITITALIVSMICNNLGVCN